MSAVDGDAVIRLSKMTAGISTTIVAALVLAVIANLWSLNVGMNSLLEWKARSDGADLTRVEWNLEKQFLYAELEQLRARVIAVEQREQPK